MCYYGLGGDLVSSVLIETKTEPNTSDHVPVTALLTLTPKYIELKTTTFQCKPKWDKCNEEVFKKHISEWLRPFDSLYISYSKELDILYPLSHLNAVLKSATEVSIPNHKSSIKFKDRKHRPWSERIHDAVRRNRLAWREWRKVDSPQDPNNPHFASMRVVVVFGLNDPLRQYFSRYRVVSQREGERRERIDESKNVQTTPTRTYCKSNRPLPYSNPNK